MDADRIAATVAILAAVLMTVVGIVRHLTDPRQNRIGQSRERIPLDRLADPTPLPGERPTLGIFDMAEARMAGRLRAELEDPERVAKWLEGRA